LPDGTELEVGSLQVVDSGDDLDDEERERLHEALDQAIESVRAGKTVDGDEVIRRLLSRP
jgi:predicted RecB family endonuclease